MWNFLNFIHYLVHMKLRQSAQHFSTILLSFHKVEIHCRRCKAVKNQAFCAAFFSKREIIMQVIELNKIQLFSQAEYFSLLQGGNKAFSPPLRSKIFTVLVPLDILFWVQPFFLIHLQSTVCISRVKNTYKILLILDSSNSKRQR